LANGVDAVIDTAIAEQKIVGAEVIVARHGEIVYRRAAGHFDREAGVAMPQNAIYRLASVTKPIVAATALAMADKGLLRLDDTVANYLPYFTPGLADGTVPDITIHQLLTHTSGLSYDYGADPRINTGLGQTDLGFEANFTLVAKQPLLFAPGTGWNYSVAIDVLGAVLAKVHGGALEDAVRLHVTGPLGMDETGFFVADFKRLAKPYADGPSGAVPMDDPHAVPAEEGEVVFAPSRIFNAEAFQSGGAGMAGTPEDLLVFFETLQNGGAPILQTPTVAAGFSNRIGALHRDDAGLRFGYFGAVVDDAAAAETPESRGSVNWGGVYGHSWLVDQANGVTMLSMSNTALEGCLGPFPKQVRNAAYAAFVSQ
jgi:CubicO group peptidase (beta-lactamase class C family)